MRQITQAQLLEHLEDQHQSLRLEAGDDIQIKAYDLLREKFRSILLMMDEPLQNSPNMSVLCSKLDAGCAEILAGFHSEKVQPILRCVGAAREKIRQHMEEEAGWHSLSSQRQYATWQEWNPRSYLETFFSKLGPDTYETLKFVRKELQPYSQKPAERLIDFGSGPTLVVSLAAEPYAKELHLADYLPENLVETKKWLDASSDAFNWDHGIQDILQLEGVEVTAQNIQNRATALRRKARTLLCDASLEYPLLEQQGTYPVVLSIFCADSATSSKETWQRYMCNISNLVAPAGRLLVAALRKCKSYRVGEREFPSANVDERDMEEVLVSGSFSKEETYVEVCNTPECAGEGFESIMFARSIKKS